MTQQELTQFCIHDWLVSPGEGLLRRGNEIVRLEPKAMEVLVYFASRPNEVISRQALEEDVWHGALIGYDAVTNTIIKLRKALQDNARDPRFITTIPKKGYQLIAPVTSPSEQVASHSPQHDPSRTAAGLTSSFLGMQKPRIMIMTLLIALVIGSTAFWLRTPSPLNSVNATSSPAVPSIAILPFENLNDDPKQAYLADGMTEDIITDLSRIGNLLVIASNTTIKYKDQHVTPEKVGEELNVGFVLKGTIRQLGDKIRVNAQLVNTQTGFNTWAQRYDRKLAEVFAVQDEVSQSIVKALAVKITQQEKYNLVQKTTNSLKAYDFFQEGLRIFRISTKESNAQAREAYRKAIQLDPGYGRAYGAIAYTLATDYRRGWTDSPTLTLDRALVLANKAVELDDASPQTHFVLSYVYLMKKDFDKAVQSAEKAIKIAPNYADGYGVLALIKNHLVQPEEAIELVKKAIRLNPYYTFEYLYIKGMAYNLLGNYDNAISNLEKAQARNQNVVQVKIFLASSYVMANRQQNAEWIIDELQILDPTLTITTLEKTIPIAKASYKQRLLNDLRTAGLPE